VKEYDSGRENNVAVDLSYSDLRMKGRGYLNRYRALSVTNSPCTNQAYVQIFVATNLQQFLGQGNVANQKIN